jgi:hypothetical protein
LRRRRGFVDLYLDVTIAYGIIIVLVIVCLSVLAAHISV